MAAAGSDHCSLVLTIHLGFAMTSGLLTVTQGSNGIEALTAADGVTPVAWTNLSLYLPSGVELETISQTVGNTATNTPASVTFQPVTPANALRSMVHVLLLKNGVTVAPDSTGASLACHYHDYLDMDGAASGPATYAAMWSGYFNSNSVVKANYNWVINGSQITLTENTPGNGDVLDLLIWAYPQDRPTGADKTALNAAIATASQYPSLASQVAIANAVDTCVYYPQSDVDAETQTLNNAINLVTSTPTFTPGAGTYIGAQDVTISNPDSVSGVVYYTTDSSDPATSSTAIQYSTPVVVSVSETVYAAVYDTVSHLWSTGAKAQYTINPVVISVGGGGVSASPQPVESPTGSAMVTPSLGGTISLNNGASTPLASINIPAGVLQGNTDADVAITNVASPPSPPEGDTIIGAYDFTVNGGSYTFNSNVTLTFTFDPAKIPAGSVPAVEYYDNTTGQWVVVEGAVANNTITVTVNHFTTFAVMAVPNAPGVAPSVTFSDVASSCWCYTAISSLSSQGIVSGYPDGSFKPDASITRAEFAAMLVKALRLSTYGTTDSFTDVNTESWYYGSANAAAAAGLVSGTGDNRFEPNALITREQMAVMVAKALGAKAPTASGTELNAFSDKSTVSSWAVVGMEEAVKAGIVSGMPDGTLAPRANATRAQAAAMIYKLLGMLGK
jgi:hypothetical protein